MRISNMKKMKLISSLSIVLLCSFAGLLFSLFIRFFLYSGDDEPIINFIILGSITGFVIPVTFLLLEPLISRIKKMPLWVSLFFQPLFFAVIIGLEYGVIYSLTFGHSDFLANSFIIETVIFSLIMSFISIFLENINRLLGAKVLRGLMIGTYHKPVQEERYVMFLDITGSTSIAEKIGDISFHLLLNDFFCDISKPVIDNFGDIYKYVGDEVIITWQFTKKTSAHSPVDAYTAICDCIAQRRDVYLKKYGVVPDFKAGLHFGKVIVGEMGSYKQEIAVLGDVMNTASRIQSACKSAGANFLLSKDAMDKLTLHYTHEKKRIFISKGNIELRGKEHPMELFTIV